MDFKPKRQIEWTEKTWNPVTGCWGPGGTLERPNFCLYCYAKALCELRGWSFEPTLHEDRLAQLTPRQRPSMIFVCSMADLFGDWVPREWIEKVLAAIERAPQHTYQLLTKNPERLSEFNPWPAQCWVGASATNQLQTERALAALADVQASVRFISFEPLLGRCSIGWPEGGRPAPPIEWLIIGACTGRLGSQPREAWVNYLTVQARAWELPVFYKKNLVWSEPRPEELPQRDRTRATLQTTGELFA